MSDACIIDVSRYTGLEDPLVANGFSALFYQNQHVYDFERKLRSIFAA